MYFTNFQINNDKIPSRLLIKNKEITINKKNYNKICRFR